MKTNWKDGELYKKVYLDNPEYGKTGTCKKNVVSKYITDFSITSVWDYGCGPNYALVKELRTLFPQIPITGYDPAVLISNGGIDNEISDGKVDFILSTDCLEHLWEDELEMCFKIFNEKSPRYIYLAICTRKAGQILSDGTNAHKTIRPAVWWETEIKKYLLEYDVVISDVVENTQHVNFLLKRRTEEFTKLLSIIQASETFPYRKNIHDWVVSKILPSSRCLEFGVYKGDTINYMASRLPNNRFYGFDSFDGLPESWFNQTHYRPKGHFKTDKSALHFEKNVEIFPGWFNKSIPKFLSTLTSEELRSIQFIHIDCDLYSSTKTIFDLLKDIILKNCPLVLFDELYNYKGYEIQEIMAFTEFIDRTQAKYKIVSHTLAHQVAIQML